MPFEKKYKRYERRKINRGMYEVVLGKSLAVILPNKNIMFIILYNRKGKKGVREGFIRTALRIGSVKCLLDFARKVSEDNPAERLNLNHLDLDDENFVYFYGRHALKADFQRYVRNRFMRAIDFEDFKTIMLCGKYDKYLDFSRTIQGLSILEWDKFEEGKWYVETIITKGAGNVPPPRKPKVIH